MSPFQWVLGAKIGVNWVLGAKIGVNFILT